MPHYLDDVIDGGFYEEFKALVRLLLDQHPTTPTHPSIDPQDANDTRGPDAIVSVPRGAKGIKPMKSNSSKRSNRRRKSKQFGSLVSLPPIQSEDLERRVFTRGIREAEDHLDNRRLEWLGDAVLQLSATLILEDQYPRIRNRVVTEIRAFVVSNRKLSQLSRRYQLYKRYFEVSGRNLNPTADSKAHGMMTIAQYVHQLMWHFPADLFEAYIGALFKEQHFLQLHQFLTDVLLPLINAAYEYKTYIQLAKKVADLQTPVAIVCKRATREQLKATLATSQTTTGSDSLAHQHQTIDVASIPEKESKESGVSTGMACPQVGDGPLRKEEARPNAKFPSGILSPFDEMCQTLGYDPHIDTRRTFTEAGIWQWVTNIHVGDQLISTCTALTHSFSQLHARHDASVKVTAVCLK